MATTILFFLNANSGAIQGVSTAILVLITLYYAWQTKKAVKEAANTRKDSRLPLVRLIGLNGPVNSRREGTIKQYLAFRVRNSGYGLAINVGLVLPQREPIKVGNISEGEEENLVVWLEDGEAEKLRDLPESDKRVYLKYKDIFGRKVETVILFQVIPMSNASESWLRFSIDSWIPIIPK